MTGCREHKAERIQQLQLQLQESEKSVEAMKNEAETAKEKLHEMEQARRAVMQVGNFHFE